MKPDRWSVPGAVLIVIAFGPAARAGEPAVGEVRTRPVITLALSAGSLDREARRVVYAPPPGWYIRSHRVECTTKTGASSFAVNTVPADWAWDSTEKTLDETRVRVKGSVKGHGQPVEAGASYRVERTVAEQTRRAASHHALVVEATAKGTGVFGSAGVLELTVTAELVYVGGE